jgi:hypothetical protein
VGVKKCFLSLWRTALLSAEGKKERLHAYELPHDLPYESVYDLVHWAQEEVKNDISWKRMSKKLIPKILNCVQFGAFEPTEREEMMFPRKLNRVRLKIDSDSYYTENTPICTGNCIHVDGP